MVRSVAGEKPQEEGHCEEGQGLMRTLTDLLSVEPVELADGEIVGAWSS